VGERIQLRRRLREQRQAREAMLLDLGALVYELHRQGRRAPELLQQKAAELEVVDGEVRELEDRLAGLAPEGDGGWAEGEEALHEDFDALGEEEPEAGDDEFDDYELEDEPDADELERTQDELADGDFADDDLEDAGLEDGDLADGDFEGGESEAALDDEVELYEEHAPDADATVEVDALDGLPEDREGRS
jgi:hypothetical protein